jgi:hypothetical protein
MMQPNLHEAREAFALAESEPDPTVKLDALEEALALVDELLDEPGMDEVEKGVARNVRKSYLRKLLQQLVQLPDVAILDWCGYIRLFVIDYKSEVQAIFDEDPELKAGFESFVALWSKEFRDAFGKDMDEL